MASDDTHQFRIDWSFQFSQRQHETLYPAITRRSTSRAKATAHFLFHFRPTHIPLGLIIPTLQRLEETGLVNAGVLEADFFINVPGYFIGWFGDEAECYVLFQKAVD